MGEECPRRGRGGFEINFSLDTRSDDGWAVVVVRGDVDAHTAPRVRDRLRRLMAEGRSRIVIDLEQVEFMDSSGLGVLVSCQKQLREQQGDMALICTRPNLRRLMSITGLDHVFAIHTRLAEVTGS